MGELLKVSWSTSLTLIGKEREAPGGGEEWMRNLVSGPALEKAKYLYSETAFMTVSKSGGRGRTGSFCVD